MATRTSTPGRARPMRRFGLCFALVALMFRLLVPQGFMPVVGASGLPALTICSGSGAMPLPTDVAATMQSALGKHHQAPAHDSDHACPFAIAGVAAERLAEAPLLPAPAITDVALPTTMVRAARPGRGLAAPPPPKTGPPLLA